VYEVKDWIAWDEAHKESRHSVRKQEDRKVPTDKWAYYNIPFKLMINYLKYIGKENE